MELRRRMMGVGGEVPFEEQYLTFEALAAGTFTLTIAASLNTTYLESVSYSTDGGSTWTKTNNVDNTEVVITTPNIAIGDKVLWKGKGTALSTGNTAISGFSSTGLFNACGNIMSLCYEDSFVDKFTASAYMFYRLFRYSKLVDASNLILQATYLGQFCYHGMFRDCKSLTTPPVLPAPTLTTQCYSYMFNKSPLVNYIKCLATRRNYANSTTGWCGGVSSSGTFVKDANATFWQSGENDIPSDWTVVNA